MPYNDIREVRDCYAALRELVSQTGGGWNEIESRATVERLCRTASAALADDECRERLRAVAAQAMQLFSRDGYLKWARKNMSGAEYLRLQILISLEALNTRLFLIETERNRASREVA